MCFRLCNAGTDSIQQPAQELETLQHCMTSKGRRKYFGTEAFGWKQTRA